MLNVNDEGSIVSPGAVTDPGSGFVLRTSAAIDSLGVVRARGRY
jgi:hypothetical protein